MKQENRKFAQESMALKEHFAEPETKEALRILILQRFSEWLDDVLVEEKPLEGVAAELLAELEGGKEAEAVVRYHQTVYVEPLESAGRETDLRDISTADQRSGESGEEQSRSSELIIFWRRHRGCGFHTDQAARTALLSGRNVSSIAGPHRSLRASALNCKMCCPVSFFHRAPQRLRRSSKRLLQVASTLPLPIARPSLRARA